MSNVPPQQPTQILLCYLCQHIASRLRINCFCCSFRVLDPAGVPNSRLSGGEVYGGNKGHEIE